MNGERGEKLSARQRPTRREEIMERENSCRSSCPGKTISTLAALHAFTQEIGQCDFERPVGSKFSITSTETLTARANGFVMRVEAFQVFLASCGRVNEQVAARFNITEHEGAFEVETQLSWIEDLHQDHLVTRCRQGSEISLKRFNRCEKIR